MRPSLFFNPFDLVERLAIASQRRRRLRRLRNTPASALGLGHINTLELLEQLRPTPPTVIYDVGANVGTWTCLAKSLFPSARVEAFEPLTGHFAGFQEWTAPWRDQVRLHTCALGPLEHTAIMQVMDYSDASSLLPLRHEGASEFKVHVHAEASVQVIPLDVLVAREKLPPPNLIKLDVQGYELEVLRGAETTLRAAKAVICEVSFREFYAGQPLFAEVVAYFDARGFTLHALAEGTALGTPLVQADALFVQA